MIQKIGHIILSFIMLIATVGIIVSKHYCGNNVYKHLFVEARCDMENMPLDKALHDHCKMDANCCHTEIESLQLHIDYLKEDKLYINPNFTFVLFYSTCALQLNQKDINKDFIPESIFILPIKKPSQSNLQIFLC